MATEEYHVAATLTRHHLSNWYLIVKVEQMPGLI